MTWKTRLRNLEIDLPARLKTFTNGLIFGYPLCCILSFDEWRQRAGSLTWGDLLRRMQEQADAPWFGTGFIPCASCVPAALADWDTFVRTRIFPTRMVMNGLKDDGV